MDPVVEISELKAEIERLKQVVKELTAALKVVAVRETSAQAFIERVEVLLNDDGS